MYLHLGKEVVVKTDDIVGIFDLEKSSLSRDTNNFLAKQTKEKNVINVSLEMPKTFILCDNKTTVYVSQISSTTLLKRCKETAKK